VPSGIRLDSTEPSSITVNVSAINGADNTDAPVALDQARAMPSASD
jgi:hypothetical protein